MKDDGIKGGILFREFSQHFPACKRDCPEVEMEMLETIAFGKNWREEATDVDGVFFAVPSEDDLDAFDALSVCSLALSQAGFDQKARRGMLKKIYKRMKSMED